MTRIRDLTNKKVGRLLVLEKDNSKLGRTFWKCQCECGLIKSIRAENLIKEKTKSCGCLHLKVRIANCKSFGRKGGLNSYKGENVAVTNAIFSRYNANALLMKREFALDKAHFTKLIVSPCSYCGSLPIQLHRGHKDSLYYNGIDRVDNKLGYTKENCISCCKMCNYAKRDKTLHEFKEWITKVYTKFNEVNNPPTRASLEG
jgi:hypothetical protein